jgi:hypothetical protein
VREGRCCEERTNERGVRPGVGVLCRLTAEAAEWEARWRVWMCLGGEGEGGFQNVEGRRGAREGEGAQ